mgnify:CR=1 FL=1
MASVLVARWRFTSPAARQWSVDWETVYAGRQDSQLVKQFAVVHTLALQRTLYEMGKAVLIDTRDRGDAVVSAK